MGCQAGEANFRDCCNYNKLTVAAQRPVEGKNDNSWTLMWLFVYSHIDSLGKLVKGTLKITEDILA